MLELQKSGYTRKYSFLSVRGQRDLSLKVTTESTDTEQTPDSTTYRSPTAYYVVAPDSTTYRSPTAYYVVELYLLDYLLNNFRISRLSITTKEELSFWADFLDELKQTFISKLGNHPRHQYAVSEFERHYQSSPAICQDPNHLKALQEINDQLEFRQEVKKEMHPRLSSFVLDLMD